MLSFLTGHVFKFMFATTPTKYILWNCSVGNSGYTQSLNAMKTLFDWVTSGLCNPAQSVLYTPPRINSVKPFTWIVCINNLSVKVKEEKMSVITVQEQMKGQGSSLSE